MKIRTLLVVGFLAATLPVVSQAAGVEQDLKDLMIMLPGEYDSELHLREDVMAGVPLSERHGWVNRSFVKVDAPDVGEHVLVQTVMYNGRAGFFDRSEFIVWTVSADEERGGVSLQPRWFKDLDAYIPVARSAADLAGLKPADLVEAGGAAGCEIFWVRKEAVFVGRTNAGDCITVSEGTERQWQWSYELSARALKINFKGLTADGEILTEAADDIPWRLDRIF